MTPREKGETGCKPQGTLKISFDKFQQAIEGFDALGEPVRYYLDTETGEILQLCRDWDDHDELLARIDEASLNRYRRIESLESRKSFRIMENFAVSLPESAIKSQLLNALSRNKPFHRFKETFHSDLVLRDRWFQFLDDAHEQHMRDWLDAEGVTAEIDRPRKAES